MGVPPRGSAAGADLRPDADRHVDSTAVSEAQSDPRASAMAKTFSVGIVGAGAISRQSHLPVLTTMPQVRVAWIVDSDPVRARSLARAYRIPAAKLPSSPSDLSGCEVALLAIPVGVRDSYLDAFARLGIGVLVEKPFARTLQAHREILAAYPPHLLACGFIRRTYASTCLFRRIVKEEWFGPLMKIRAREGSRTGATRTDRSFFDQPMATGGGVLAEGGCHALDQALYITGAAGYDILESRMIFDGSVDRKAEGRVRLALEGSGRVAVEYCFSWLDQQPNTLELEFGSVRLVTGTSPDSSVVIEGLRAAEVAEVTHLAPSQGARTSSQAFRLHWQEFFSGIEEGTESKVSAASCLSTTAIVEDLYLKARST